jgi:hypothetical protein
VSKNLLEKLTISTRYQPPTTQTSLSNSGAKNKSGGGGNNNSGSGWQIGSSSNAVTVVKVRFFKFYPPHTFLSL